jgi:hypothetical protein
MAKDSNWYHQKCYDILLLTKRPRIIRSKKYRSKKYKLAAKQAGIIAPAWK